MAYEGWTFDGTNINGTDISIEEVDLTPPAKRSEWAQGADSDGAALVRDPLHENRTIKFKLRIERTASMLLALQKIAALSRKIEECEQNPDGLPLVWTPADGTVGPLTFYVLSGFVSELPIAVQGDSGWFVNAPSVSVELTCKPFGYGAEVVGSGVSSTAPVLTLTVANVPGDVPAEGRLIVTDAATQNRRTVEWGLEQRFYDPATSLIVDSDDMVVTGYAGVQATRAGAYDPNGTGNNVVRTTLAGAATAAVGLPVLTHVGSYRVRARVYATGDARLRLAWQDGSGPSAANSYAAPPAVNAFSDMDLGVITIAPARLGSQVWSGDLQASGSGTIDIDYLTLVPNREGYGRARGETRTKVNVLIAYDKPDYSVSLVNLNGLAPKVGAAWATAGSGVDFQTWVGRFARFTSASDASVYRTATIGGSATDTQVTSDVLFYTDNVSSSFTAGIMARYVDASNFLMASVVLLKGSASVFQIVQRVTGTDTVLASKVMAVAPPYDMGLSLSATADGAVVAQFGTDALAVQSSVVATGGALASGKAGLVHRDIKTGGNSSNPFWSNISVSKAFPLSPAVYSGRTIEFRSSGDALMQNSGGTVYGQAPSYRGSRFLIPPAGDKNRTSRIAVRAHRNDLDAGAFEPLGDNLTAQVRYTPRYLVVNA